MNLENKVAIITGSTMGIGRAIAEKLAASGAKVVVTGRKQEDAQKAAQEIAAETGAEALGCGLNVLYEDQIKQCVADTVKTFGKVDILINNAGIQTIHPIVEFNTEDFTKLLNIHLTGGFIAARECMKQMIKQGTGGKIITVGSTHSVCASPNKAAYVAAKHGLVGLNKSIAVEGGDHNITANLICPGFVWSHLVEKQIPERAAVEGISEEEVKKSMLKNTVDNEFSSQEDVANVALFFASFETNALTGQSLIVSHGWNMQ
ncbi:3-hydroxybutyrate dehydrogenase [Lentisphaerota bacterium ZTH]|nr:3-hydroxybutyrate dehydrogenase [Lentisphaerota bacterium]WET07737.1 3-hydroxybutyrate dehydrogenase [Lentisphaerota bacterium ZTH]